MMPRSIVFGLAILLICGIAGAAPSRESARAQDADDVWPEIPTFRVPGTFQVSGTVDDAGDIAEVSGTIRVVSGGDGQATLAIDVGVDLILDNSGSMVQTLGDERRIDIAKLVLTALIEETLPSGIPLALRVFGDEPDSCETDLAIDLASLDKDVAADRIASIESVDGVKTLLAAWHPG